MFIQMLSYGFVGGFIGLAALGHVLLVSALLTPRRFGPRGGMRLRPDVSNSRVGRRPA